MFVAEFCACTKSLDVLAVRKCVVAYGYLMELIDNVYIAFLKYEKRIPKLLIYTSIRWSITSNAIFFHNIRAPTAIS